jgi:putative spermidine/putrescine transport system permease protein
MIASDDRHRPMSVRALSHWFERKPFRLLLIPMIFLAVAYVVPLALILFNSLSAGGELSLDRYREYFSSTAFLLIIWRTIRISAIATLLALLLGYPYAYMLLKLPGRWRALFAFIAIAPFFTSILIRSYAWVAVLGDNGLINNLLIRIGLIAEPIQLVYNETGTLIGMTQVQLPLMIFTLYGTMRRIDPTLTRAAESLGAHPLTGFFKIFLPLSLPGIASGCALVFTSSLGFYVTPALLGGPGQFVATQSIYQQVAAVGDLNAAATQASVLLILVLLLIVLLRQSLVRSGPRAGAAIPAASRSSSYRITFLSYLPEAVFRRIGPGMRVVSATARGLLIASFAFTAILLVAPLAIVFPLAFSDQPYLSFPPSGFSLRWIEAYVTDEGWRESTYFSAWISLSAGLLATVVGSVAAYAMNRWSSAGKSFVEIFFLSPMIVPQFVVALAMYFIIAKLRLVGNPLTFIVAYAVFGFPLVFLIMYATFQRFDHSLVQAAAILGARPLYIWRRVAVPILAPSFMSALFFAFLVAFDDLVVGLFFSTAESYTLPMRMWDDIRLEISPRIAAVAVVFFVAAIAIVALGRVAALAARRFHHAHRRRSGEIT